METSPIFTYLLKSDNTHPILLAFMSFVRTKTINGREYLYLVENRRIGDTTRQRVIKYLGKANRRVPRNRSNHEDKVNDFQETVVARARDAVPKSEVPSAIVLGTTAGRVVRRSA
jgi:hypothetical protein